MSIMAKDELTGEEVELHTLVCSGCGGPMDGHVCPGGSFTVTRGAVNHVNTARTGVKRAKKEDKEKCGHCGGIMHFNLGGGFEDMQCTWRQYLIAQGIVTDPFAKLPKMIPGSDDIDGYNGWVKTTRPTYGKAGGVAGTYSAVKSLEAAANPKEREARKPKKGLEATVAEAAPPAAEEIDLDAVEIVTAPPTDVEAPTPETTTPRGLTPAEKRRQAGQERRKALLRERARAVR